MIHILIDEIKKLMIGIFVFLEKIHLKAMGSVTDEFKKMVDIKHT